MLTPGIIWNWQSNTNSHGFDLFKIREERNKGDKEYISNSNPWKFYIDKKEKRYYKTAVAHIKIVKLVVFTAKIFKHNLKLVKEYFLRKKNSEKFKLLNSFIVNKLNKDIVECSMYDTYRAKS